MNKALTVFTTIANVLFGTLTLNTQEKSNPKDTFIKIDNYLSNGTSNGFLVQF